MEHTTDMAVNKRTEWRGMQAFGNWETVLLHLPKCASSDLVFLKLKSRINTSTCEENQLF